MAKRRKPGETEALVKRLYNEGYNAEEIAEQIGILKRTVDVWLNTLGIRDYDISKKWLYESGVGNRWDDVCRKIREGAKT